MFKGVNRPSLPDRVLGKIYAYDIKKGNRPRYIQVVYLYGIN